MGILVSCSREFRSDLWFDHARAVQSLLVPDFSKYPIGFGLGPSMNMLSGLNCSDGRIDCSLCNTRKLLWPEERRQEKVINDTYSVVLQEFEYNKPCS